MIIDSNSNAPLTHYGTKGMRWGVRKQLPTHPSYTASRQAQDRQWAGKGGVRRINQRLHKGQSYQKATGREALRRTSIRIGATAATAVLLKAGSLKLSETLLRGAGSPMALPPGLTVIRPRRGVYNISTL